MPSPVRTPKLALLAFTTLLALGATALAQDPDFGRMLTTIDQLGSVQGDVSATFTMVATDPSEGDKVQEVRFFRSDAEDKFLLLVLRPETQLGQGYLNIEDGLWFYDPESRQFTFTSLSESFQGSDANNDDFGTPSYAADYVVASGIEGTLGAYDVWILELEAAHDEVTYPFKTIWVAKDPTLVLKSEDYSLTRRLLRTSFFPSYARVGESFVADRMLFVDALVEGKMTEITIDQISSAELPDSVFTKAYVERVNR